MTDSWKGASDPSLDVEMREVNIDRPMPSQSNEQMTETPIRTESVESVIAPQQQSKNELVLETPSTGTLQPSILTRGHVSAKKNPLIFQQRFGLGWLC